MSGGAPSRGHQLLEDDVLRNEHQGRAKGADEPENVRRRDIERAREHDSEGERKEREIGRRRIRDFEEECIGEHGKER